MERLLGYEGLYNFYNIGATSHADYLQVIKNGLQYAKDGKGASQETRTKYIIPWNTKERSITGGGIFIGSRYINVGQNTIYLQKFDVNDERSNVLFWHQYMTNILAPYSEAKIIYTGYLNSGLLNYPISFTIPVYNNMPTLPQDSPSISLADFIDDSAKVYANVANTLNIRTGPGTSYEVLCSVTRNDVMTRIKKGKQQGELWDKVILGNGMVGYAFQSYLQEVPKAEIQEINLSIENNVINKNQSLKLNVEILPNTVKEKVVFSSQNSSVAIVDGNGIITGITSGTVDITAASQNRKGYKVN